MTTPYIYTDYANTSSYRVLVNIRGVSGILTGLGIAGGDSYHYFRVKIDGNNVVDEFLCGTMSKLENNGLGINLPFNNELIVEIRDSKPSPLPRFWCSFYTHHSTKVKEEFTIELIEGVNYVYKVEYFEYEGKRYTIKSSYGNAKISRVVLEKDTYFAGESIKGNIELKDWQGNPLSEEKVILILRPLGRRTELQKFEIGSVKDKRGFEIKLPNNLRGDFELLCDLKGYANFPAVFTVI
jgi:hypothetical protein